MERTNLTSSHVDGMLFWQCVYLCANPARYTPKPIERLFLERVIRAYRNGRRLRDNVQSAARGVVRTYKERQHAERGRGGQGIEIPSAGQGYD